MIVFQIKDHPLYHLIKARILKKQEDMAEAVKTLQLAMALPGVKMTGTFFMPSRRRVRGHINLPLSLCPRDEESEDILIYPCPSVRPSGYRYMVCPAISSYSF